MEKLEKLLKETDYTDKDWQIYKKVQRHFYLEDLKTHLFCESEDRYTKKQLETIDKLVDIIIERYDDYIEYDWESALLDAINSVLE